MQMSAAFIDDEPAALTPPRLVMMHEGWIPLSPPDKVKAARPNAAVVSQGGEEVSIRSIHHPIHEVDPTWAAICRTAIPSFWDARIYQEKIRGHRIEPGEVETVLRRHPAIRETAVAAVGESRGNRHLVAYIVPVRPPADDSDKVRMGTKN